MSIPVAAGGDVAAELAAEAVDAAAGAAQKAAARVAAEGASVETLEAVGEAAGNAAGQAQAQKDIEAGVEKAAGKGASEVVKTVIRAVIISTMIEEIFRNTVKIVDTLEANGKVKHMLTLLSTALGDVKANMKTWNVQVTTAIADGKLKETVKLTDGSTVSIGSSFSSDVNSKVSECLSTLQPSMINLSRVAKAEHPDINKIEGAVNTASAAFLQAAGPFCSALKEWDERECAIKREAGVDFRIQQLDSNVNAIKDEYKDA